jgi:hypothetical protein
MIVPGIKPAVPIVRFRFCRAALPFREGSLIRFALQHAPRQTVSASFFRSSFLRSFSSSSLLRNRIDFGVTSTNSLSSI